MLKMLNTGPQPPSNKNKKGVKSESTVVSMEVESAPPSGGGTDKNPPPGGTKITLEKLDPSKPDSVESSPNGDSSHENLDPSSPPDKNEEEDGAEGGKDKELEDKSAVNDSSNANEEEDDEKMDS